MDLVLIQLIASGIALILKLVKCPPQAKNVPLGQNRRRGRPCNAVLVAHLKKIITKFWLKIALPLLSSHINEANKPSTSKNGTKNKRGRYLRKSSYKELKYKKR